MKRAFLTVLMVCLLIAPARAEAISGRPMEDYVQNSNVVAATLDELQEAIAAADDGDTIEIAQTIKVAGEDIATEKDITIACAEIFEDDTMFRTREGSIVGLSFKGGRAKEIFAVVNDQEEETIFQNCRFDGENEAVAVNVYGAIDISGSGKTSSVRIIDSEFKNCLRSAISARASTNVVMDRCYIHETYAVAATGAIDSSGSVALNDCLVTGNSSYANAGVLCTGTLIVSGGQIRDNTIRSTDVGVAVDIFCSGTWSIIDEETEGEGYYDIATGEKLPLPIHKNDIIAKLVYLKDEAAKEYFSFLLEPDIGEDGGNNTPEPPQEPTQPPEGENPDNPDIGDQNTPQQPEQPPQDETTDNPADTTPDTSQPPQNPSEDSNGNYTPPIDYRPSQRPTKPAEDDRPQDQPDDPAPEKPQLACNGAVIDTARTVVLLGYEDGLLHEGDPLCQRHFKMSFFAEMECHVLQGGIQVLYGLIHHNTCRLEARQALIYQLASGLTGENGKYNYSRAVHFYPPFSYILCSAKSYKIASALTVEPENCELEYIQYSGWALEAIQTAVALEWIEDSSMLNPDAVISRGELVDLINAVLAQYQ